MGKGVLIQFFVWLEMTPESRREQPSQNQKIFLCRLLGILKSWEETTESISNLGKRPQSLSQILGSLSSWWSLEAPGKVMTRRIGSYIPSSHLNNLPASRYQRQLTLAIPSILSPFLFSLSSLTVISSPGWVYLKFAKLCWDQLADTYYPQLWCSFSCDDFP